MEMGNEMPFRPEERVFVTFQLIPTSARQSVGKKEANITNVAVIVCWVYVSKLKVEYFAYVVNIEQLNGGWADIKVAAHGRS